MVVLLGLVLVIRGSAQTVVAVEAQLTESGGEHTPLWLNANKHGLSSLDKQNGYVRAGFIRPLEADSGRQWRRAFGADMALATGFTSTVVLQQFFGELGWKHGLLTIGAKEQPLEQKNEELSTGAQTLGINARPVPGFRLALPEYWTIPGTSGWLGLKGHIFYGWTTDDRWQKDFTAQRTRYTENTALHTKAGFLRIGKTDKPFSFELGLEMGCQFGGTSLNPEDTELPVVKNKGGLASVLHAFIPGGGEASEADYRNKEGNHVGSWLLRANYDADKWGLSLYADHFFEDQSQMFFLDYDGYGSDEHWDSWEHFDWLLYDLRDIMLGAELRLKDCRWADTWVAEYIYTKYQSGPIYHDHTRTMSDHVGGLDYYYDHSIFTGWQHWGQVMGNPLYRSPLYNEGGEIRVLDNRFWGWHIGFSGSPMRGLRYRMLATWQKGFGTYKRPFAEPRYNLSILAEAAYCFPITSALKGWSLKGALALDYGRLLGNNHGIQLTVGRQFQIDKNKRTHE